MFLPASRAAPSVSRLRRLAPLGQLIEQPGRAGGYRLERGLEGIVLWPGGIA